MTITRVVKYVNVSTGDFAIYCELLERTVYWLHNYCGSLYSSRWLSVILLQVYSNQSVIIVDIYKQATKNLISQQLNRLRFLYVFDIFFYFYPKPSDRKLADNLWIIFERFSPLTLCFISFEICPYVLVIIIHKKPFISLVIELFTVM